jgi:uncharacterized protein DUF2357
MNGVLTAAQAQLHFWPWSVEISAQTMDLMGGNVSFPFFGSPVISLLEGATLLLPSRLERFTPLGPPYQSSTSTCQVYETPHGILAGSTHGRTLRLRTSRGSQHIAFNAQGAAERFDLSSGTGQQVYSDIARYILAWSQVFDELMEKAHTPGSLSDAITWEAVLDQLHNIPQAPNQPRMALIVRIAQQMHRRLPDIVSAMRKILLRERDLVPLHRIQETDNTCLRWYARQPGNTTPEKAGSKQRLLAIVRKESFDTLENRVLKDFVLRCSKEAAHYLNVEVGPRMQGTLRASDVKRYKSVCNMCITSPSFEQVSLPDPGTQPNYVLQNDLRYRKVWYWYRQLLRRADVEDQIWDWQTRTWADVMRLLVGAVMERLTMENGLRSRSIRDGVAFEKLAHAPLRLRSEQSLGSRILPGSEPGPFLLVLMANGHPVRKAVMEVVHPDLSEQHSVAQLLGRTGGHLYLVLHEPGRADGRKQVLVLWSVNGAGATDMPHCDEMASAAWDALQQHYIVLSLRRRFPALIRGMVVVSRLEASQALFHDGNGHRLPLLEVPADPRGWESAVEWLALGLDAIFEDMLQNWPLG